MITMYDSIELATIPRSAVAVAGYVGGFWPTFHKLEELWPHSHRLSIAVQPSFDAHCLDVEKGDADPSEAPAWVRRQHARGVQRPVLYASVSSMPVLLAAMAAAGVPRKSFRLWTAHYTGVRHLCDSTCWTGFKDWAGATQYTNRAFGRNLDASVVQGSWWFPR